MPDDERRFHRLQEHARGRRSPVLAAPVGALCGALLGGAAWAAEAAMLKWVGAPIGLDMAPVAAACALIGAGFGAVAGVSGLWGGAWLLGVVAGALVWALTGVLTPSLAEGVPPMATALAGVGLSLVAAQVVGRLPLPQGLQVVASCFGGLVLMTALPVHAHLLASPADGLAVAVTALILLVVSPLAVVGWSLTELGRGPLLPAAVLAGVTGGLVALPQVEAFEALPSDGAVGPPIVVVVVQGLRADRLGSGGYERDVTPHLDRFARRAVHFREAESTSSWSVPATASLLSSRWPHRHGAGVRLGGRPAESPLRPDVHGWPTLLAWHGYRTAAVVGDPGLAPYGLGAGFERWADAPALGPLPWMLRPMVAGGLDLGRFPLRSTASEVTDRSLAWLGEEPAGKALLVVYADAGGAFDFDDPELAAVGLTTRPWPADDHDASLHRVDRELGRLLDALPDDALIVVAGDRGVRGLETRGADHLWGHHLFPELTHVPLLVRAPGLSGRAITEPVSLVDVGPTVLRFAGVDVPEGLDGRTLDPVFGRSMPERPLLAAATRYGPDQRAVRRGRYRMVWTDGHEALYDLAVDPLQRDALGQEPALEPVRRELRALLPPDAGTTAPVPFAARLGRVVVSVVEGHR